MFERLQKLIDLYTNELPASVTEQQIRYLMATPEIQTRARALSAGSGLVAEQSHGWNSAERIAVNRLRTGG